MTGERQYKSDFMKSMENDRYLDITPLILWKPVMIGGNTIICDWTGSDSGKYPFAERTERCDV